jgi:hypothetical protein
MAYKTRPGETQHQARERIAREKGFGSYREYRKRSGQERERATRQLAANNPEYARTVRASSAAIRTRAARDERYPGGRVLTTTDYRRLRAAVRDAEPTSVELHFRVVVFLGGIDRRRKDARRQKGRDTAYRTLRFTAWPDDFDTSDADGFAGDLDAMIDGALDRLYAGGGGAAWALDTVRLIVPGRAAA